MTGAIHESVALRDAACRMTPVDQERVFQRVVVEFGPAMARFSMGYELDPAKREDLCQEILIALWRSLALFDSRCSLRTWVYRVAHNTAVKHVLKEKRRAVGTWTSLDEIEEAPDPGDLEDEAHRETVVHQLSLLISKLEPLDRQVILLYLEDMGAETIAEITGLSRKSIGVRVHRIKHLLRKIADAGAQDVGR